MSTEIKIHFSEVEKALLKVKATCKSLETTLPTSIGGDSSLQMLIRLTELNESLQKVTESYKVLLSRNEEATNGSIESIRKQDEQIASASIPIP